MTWLCLWLQSFAVEVRMQTFKLMTCNLIISHFIEVEMHFFTFVIIFFLFNHERILVVFFLTLSDQTVQAW